MGKIKLWYRYIKQNMLFLKHNYGSKEAAMSSKTTGEQLLEQLYVARLGKDWMKAGFVSINASEQLKILFPFAPRFFSSRNVALGACQYDAAFESEVDDVLERCAFEISFLPIEEMSANALKVLSERYAETATMLTVIADGDNAIIQDLPKSFSDEEKLIASVVGLLHGMEPSHRSSLPRTPHKTH